MFSQKKVSNIIFLMFFTLFLFLISGCTYKSTVAIDSSNEDKTFKGLNKIFSESEDIVIYHIHGMGRHHSKEDSIVSFYNKVATQMGFDKLSNECFKLKENDFNYGNMTIFNSKNKNSRNFKVVSLSWSDITLPKQLSLNNDSNPYLERVAYANKKIKMFMNDGFGDAILYLNPNYKEAVHTSIRLGIEKACIEDTKLCNPKNVIVSSSLGSKMLFDVLDENYVMKEAKYKDFFPQIAQIFMTSNQIPLIDLFSTDISIKHSKGEKDLIISQNLNTEKANSNESTKTLYKIENIINKYSSKNKKLPIIAFSDPNDALSYYIPYTGKCDRTTNVKNCVETMSFTNVTVSYANWWWFGILANPVLAHGGFMKSDIGADALINGSDNLEFKNYKRN
jgi:hypothetical protein